MSDVAEAPAAVQVSAGTLLRRAREAVGLHVAALAVSLKVPVRKLEALEDDRYDEIGDTVFLRALAASVCRTLKVDAQPILERLPQTSTPRLVPAGERLNTPFRAPSDAAPPSWVDKLRQPVPLAVMALLLGAVVIALVPIRRQEAASTAANAAAPAPAVAAAASEPQAAFSPATDASQAGQAAAAPAAVAPPAIAAAADNPAQPPSQSAAAPAATAAAEPASGIVVVRAKGDSWVEIVDAKGAAPVRKVMATGESVGASGVLPLRVTIGKVDHIEVQVRGQPFDLKPVSRDNVARFQVK
jgi:cytoskeleton protein RodZ